LVKEIVAFRSTVSFQLVAVAVELKIFLFGTITEYLKYYNIFKDLKKFVKLLK